MFLLQSLFLDKLIKKLQFQNFKRLLSKLAEKTITNNDDHSINIPTLYVPRKYKNYVYQIVKPKIDSQYLSKFSESIQRSCDIRNIKLNVADVVKYAEEYEVLLSKEIDCTRQLKKLKDSFEIDKPSGEKLEIYNHSKKKFINEISFYKKKLGEVENAAMPYFALIPNILDDKTPIESDVASVVKKPKEFSFPIKSHILIGKDMACLKFLDVSPTSYYLTGQLACLEQAIQSFFEVQLEEKYFVPISGTDLCKSFVIDACGEDPYSFDDNIPLQLQEKESEKTQRTHLVGATSLASFCVYFVNMNFDDHTLPTKYYFSGRFYDSKYRNNNMDNLFSVIQSNCLHCAIISKVSDRDMCFDELYNAILHCFNLLNIPYRVLHISAKNLSLVESRRTDVEIWSPSLQKYITCANISQCNDFISKRLQMTHGTDFTVDGYLNVVHGLAAKIPTLIGCIIENMQLADGTFLIPDVLKEYV